MKIYFVVLLVILALSLTTTVWLLGALTSRHRAKTATTFKYPVPEEAEAESQPAVLEEDAAVYNVPEKKTDDLRSRFEALMTEQKPYLDYNITIEAIAGILGTNKSSLSKMINDYYDDNFRQVLNSYRVKEAVELFEKDNTMTMDQLRKASGFNSISTFTSSFSRFAGATPGEFCKKLTNKQ
ncbi:MAG: helix-turn-helix transcriptional regulator [Bacteroidales bacterium]|nr:helix-turn-helix transcriptional regulator [Bacteroidales bacterium]